MRKTIEGFRMDALIAKHIENIFLNFDLFLINIENHENSANESKIYIYEFFLLFFFFGFLKEKKDRKMGYDKSYQKIFITLHNCQYYLIKKLISQLYA
jgi:hypothetical protein